MVTAEPELAVVKTAAAAVEVDFRTVAEELVGVAAEEAVEMLQKGQSFVMLGQGQFALVSFVEPVHRPAE